MENAIEYVSDITEYSKIADAFSFSDLKKGNNYRSIELSWKEEKPYLNTLAFTTFNKSGIENKGNRTKKILIKKANTFNYSALQRLKEEKMKSYIKWQSLFDKFPCLTSVTINNYRNDMERLFDLIINAETVRNKWRNRKKITSFSTNYYNENEEIDEEPEEVEIENKIITSRNNNISNTINLKNLIIKNQKLIQGNKLNSIQTPKIDETDEIDYDFIHEINFSESKVKVDANIKFDSKKKTNKTDTLNSTNLISKTNEDTHNGENKENINDNGDGDNIAIVLDDGNIISNKISRFMGTVGSLKLL